MELAKFKKLRINQTSHEILKLAAASVTPITIRDLTKTIDVNYAKANALFKRLVSDGLLLEHEGYGLECEITPLGKEALEAIDSGIIRVKQDMFMPSKHNKKPSPPPAPTLSTHDDIAAKFIQEMALPIAFNSKLNNCLGNIDGLVSTFFEEFESPKDPITDLDHHNVKLYQKILSIHLLLSEASNE